MLRAMRVTVRAGLPSLDITYRNDVGAPPDPSHRYEFGRTEWHDLEAAVLYAQQHGARSVVLVGASMGGAIVASFMQHSSHVSLVSALVLDAPMLSFDRTVDLGASEKSIPLLGLPLPPTLTWTAKRLASVRYDVDWSALNYLHETAWDRVPTLVFHGDADQRVPLGGSRVLDRRQPDRVDLVVVPGVGHLESWNKDPQAYEQKLTSFLSGRT
jgi:alpha-beta hydrolase superfamily lysophospholipase